MITRIIGLLRALKPRADAAWIAKLPDMALRLEASLYRMAPSCNEYNNDAIRPTGACVFRRRARRSRQQL